MISLWSPLLLLESIRARGGEISLPVTYVSLIAENKNNSTTCKFVYILDVFSLCLTKCKIETNEQRQNKRKTLKQEQKKGKTNSPWLCLILPKSAGSVNCARADRVTCNV